MNPYLLFILLIIVGGFLLDGILSLLNLRSLDPEVPKPFRETVDREQYAKSQEYTAVTTKFSLVREVIMMPLTVGFIVLGGFNWLDLIVRGFGLSEIVTGLCFMALLGLLSLMIDLPFSIYSTFVIEERFGFNKTTLATFFADLLKTMALSVLIGGPLLAFILWFFAAGGPYAWIYCWIAVTLFLLVVQFLAPVVIMPLFNKFTPLEDQKFREEIAAYAASQDFAVQGVYTMDGSRRSTKLNAFFTGFGRFRRIVFFDTLLAKLTHAEILAVLGHEMGHFKLKHILKMLLASILQTGLLFWILSLFLENEQLFAAFGMEKVSIYASLVFFGFLYAPISTILSIFLNWYSRKNEYEADAFATNTLHEPEALISGLKKLSLENLANLTPHPWFVFVNYSHPPILERLKAIAAHGNCDRNTDSCQRCGQSLTPSQLHWSDQTDGILCSPCLDDENTCGCSDE